MAQIKTELKVKRRNNRLRNNSGQNITEFGAAIAILVCLILIPLLSVSLIPIRYGFCQGIITELVTRLSHSETRTAAYNTLNNDGRWKASIASCGSEIKDTKLVLVITTATGGKKELIVKQGDVIPPEWLPDGNLAPCVYSLHLDCTCAISPLFGGGGGITGFNAPVALTVSSSAHWENLSRDPKSATLTFFVNE